MDEPAFKDKFIGFVDILGFKNMVEAAERGEGRSLTEIRELLSMLGRERYRNFFEEYGPEMCPESDYLRKDLDFQFAQVSDCIVASAEVSPAGVINLIKQCWGAAIMLLTKGVMVRGYITRGTIYHQGTGFLGSGYHTAYEKERSVTAFKREADEKGTPFVEIDPSVCSYVQGLKDRCVQEMFDRFTRTEEGVTGLFPFKVLSHSCTIGGYNSFDPAKEKQSNDSLRQSLKRMKQQVVKHVDAGNESAVRKVRHYVAALDAQIAQCDDTDEMIDVLCQPFPAGR
jgi:hypothetical protein